jgi:hypothetical protein
MAKEKYELDFEEFMKEHPEVNWDVAKPVIQPAIQSSEDQLYNWIMSYIFM